MTNIVKKPNVMKQMAGNCIQPPSQRPTGDKTQKKKCFKAKSPRNPPKEEEETKVRIPETSENWDSMCTLGSGFNHGDWVSVTGIIYTRPSNLSNPLSNYQLTERI